MMDKTPLQIEKSHEKNSILKSQTIFRDPKSLLEERQEFSAVKHELASPIAGIRTCAMSLLRGDLGPLGPAPSEFIVYIKEYAESLDLLLRQYLEYLYLEKLIQPENFSEIEIAGLLKRKRDFFLSEAQRRNVYFQFYEKSEINYVKGDMEKLNRAFDYLILFFLKKAPEGGEVTVLINGQNSLIQIAIIDKQNEISKEDKLNIFKPFFLLSDGSSRGMSLALGQKIIALHGGDVSVENLSPRGSQFLISLPKV